MSTLILTIALGVGAVWSGVAVVLGVATGRAVRLADARRPSPVPDYVPAEWTRS